MNSRTLDVKSLYTNISNHEGIEAVKSALNSASQKAIATNVFSKYLFLILTLNNFVFNGIHYLQKKDVLWEQYVHQITLIFSWENLKKHTFTHP